MPEPLRRISIFLCHSSSDKPTVRELYRKLVAEGWLDVWLDEEKLFPGQVWPRQIEQAVESADAILVCLSSNSVTKEGYVQKEVRKVLDVAEEKPEGTIFVVPLRIDDCQVPRSLNSLHYVDYFPAEQRDQAYRRLLGSLRMRADSLGIFNTKPVEEKIHSLKQDKESEKPASITANRATFAGLEFVRVPAGPFLMGSAEDNLLADADEMLQHTVDIPYDYWIGRFPVTNEQYEIYTRAIGKRHPVTDWERKRNHPVAHIHWKEDGQAYIKWLNEQGWFLPQGLVFRLPTEAEWEKAARGLVGREWPWGNEFDKDKCNTSEDGTTPVGKYSPRGDSPYGCADMASNVWEWTLSVMKRYPYNSRDGREDLQAEGSRVLRGGSFTHDRLSGRCAYRSIYKSINLFERVIGFRVAVSIPKDSYPSFIAPVR